MLVELGDLFATGTDKTFVLLAQPCDLMLRGKDGARRATVGTLVPIVSPGKRKDGDRHPYKDVGPIFYPKCPYFQAQDDGNYWLFNFS